LDACPYIAQYDGMPISLIEAASAQMPILALIGGISELMIRGKAGFLVSPCDAVDLFAKCLELMRHDKTSRIKWSRMFMS